jgi:hypothetical protein
MMARADVVSGEEDENQDKVVVCVRVSQGLWIASILVRITGQESG